MLAAAGRQCRVYQAMLALQRMQSRPGLAAWPALHLCLPASRLTVWGRVGWVGRGGGGPEHVSAGLGLLCECCVLHVSQDSHKAEKALAAAGARWEDEGIQLMRLPR